MYFVVPVVADELPFMNPVPVVPSTQFTPTTSSVRTTDNTGMGSMTINVDSLKAQLVNLPENIQNQLLQRLAMQKLQQDMQMAQTSSAGFDMAAASPGLHNNAGLLSDMPMSQAGNTEQNTMNMIQQYLGDQGTSVSFESLEALSGNIMNVEFDPNIGAMESVMSDEKQMDEANMAIHAMNQS